jgi:hypothetical protein
VSEVDDDPVLSVIHEYPAVVFAGVLAMQSQTPNQWPLDYGTTIIVDLDLMDNTPFFAVFADREHDTQDRLFHVYESFDEWWG